MNPSFRLDFLESLASRWEAPTEDPGGAGEGNQVEAAAARRP